MLIEFLHWWTEQLAACLPARWRGDNARQGTAIVLEWQDGGPSPFLAVAERQGGQTKPIETLPLASGETALAERLRALLARAGTARPQDKPLILRLPGSLLLERDVVLPLAVGRDAERAVGYDLDRLTPFQAADVYWTAARQSQDREKGELTLRLSLIAKASARPMLEALDRLGIAPAMLEAPRPGGGDCAIALTPPDQAAERRDRRTLALLGSLCGALALLAILLPFAQQSWLEAELDDRIAALRPAVSEVETLRRRLLADTASGDAIAAQQAATGDPLAALAALTAILPDNTFLQDFSMAERKISLRGQSKEAAPLIAAMTNDPALRNPTFSAPIMRVSNGQMELFAIRAEWGP